MSLHLFPRSRRRFLQATVASGFATLCWRPALAAAKTDPDTWALVADTHVSGDESAVARDANMFANFNQVIDQILAEDPLPAGVIINGDCAYLKGLEKDYVTLHKALTRLVDAGLPVHMTMGNHDDRQPFYRAIASQHQDNPPVDGKHVAVLRSASANLFLVDSLKEVDVVTGELGTTQLDWLRSALQAHDDKPAYIFGHHNPQNLPEGSTARVTGLLDTQEFIDTLHSQPHAQAYFYGHTHDWKLTKTEDQIHLINQPPSAYVFKKSRPNGWVRLNLSDDQFSVELRALDKSHPQHGEKHVLEHRLANVK